MSDKAIEAKSEGVARIARKFFSIFRPQKLTKAELQEAEQILRRRHQEGKKHE